jgi:protein-L-isoaspartate(D-aspartate) O-methyltransferase
MKSLILISFLLLFFSPNHWNQFARSRELMVKQQIKDRGIKHKATLKAMATVPRHLFVPADQVKYAYDDRPLPIGYGQTISQPYIVGYMTEIVRPNANSRVLEIGTGSGYQAAVLAQIVKEVYTVEIVEPLSVQSAALLSKLNYKNVQTRKGDGYFGWKEKAPYDAIVVTAAAEHIPPPLVAQLTEGGRMIIPVGSPYNLQQLMLIEKSGGKIRTTSMMPVRFVPFKRSQ